MLRYATGFNQDLGAWDVSRVTTMHRMFTTHYAFDQDLSTWDVAQVTDMTNMFHNAGMRHGLAAWDVSQVTQCNNFQSTEPGCSPWFVPAECATCLEGCQPEITAVTGCSQTHEGGTVSGCVPGDSITLSGLRLAHAGQSVNVGDASCSNVTVITDAHGPDDPMELTCLLPSDQAVGVFLEVSTAVGDCAAIQSPALVKYANLTTDTPTAPGNLTTDTPAAPGNSTDEDELTDVETLETSDLLFFSAAPSASAQVVFAASTSLLTAAHLGLLSMSRISVF